MSHRIAVGAFALFFVLTLALAANLTGFQSGTRELAPAPLARLTLGQAPPAGQTDDGSLVILNSQDTEVRKTILEVQRELAALGYRPGPADGNATLLTRAAAMAFEFDSGLPLTAAVDGVQLQRLLLGTGRTASPPDSNSRLPAAPEARQVMQIVKQSLKQLGYDPGPVDGSYAAETGRAIRNLETDQNLPETGRVSGRLVETLYMLESRGKVAVNQH